MSETKVTKLALASRLIVLALQLLSNALLPDHQPDVFRAPVTVPYTGWQQSAPADINNNNNNTTSTSQNTFMDAAVTFCLGGLRHWDGEYFLHIAEHSYSYENTLAFYPLYPLLVRTGARILHYMTLGMGLGLSLRSCSLLVAVALNLYCFCKAANALYALTQRIFGDLHKSWNAALLFCFNPAAIFFSAAYSEALFCCLSLHLMLECVGEMRLLRMTTALALSIVSRSNGLVNAGFPLYFCARKLLLPTQKHFYFIFRLIICLCGSLLPLTVFYFYAFQQFCLPQLESGKDQIAHEPAVAHYAQARNYVLAGQRQPHNSPWCDLTFPFPYSYIQSHYWHVGFLRYYEFKQLPNFLLAAPILVFLLLHCYKYLRHFMRSLMPKYPLRQLLDEYKSLPFVVHSLVLALFCTFFVHIQISTRLLCSSTPCLYWFAADHLPKTFDQIKLRSKAGLILAWFGSYFVLGTALFSNNLPWT